MSSICLTFGLVKSMAVFIVECVKPVNDYCWQWVSREWHPWFSCHLKFQSKWRCTDHISVLTCKKKKDIGLRLIKVLLTLETLVALKSPFLLCYMYLFFNITCLQTCRHACTWLCNIIFLDFNLLWVSFLWKLSFSSCFWS